MKIKALAGAAVTALLAGGLAVIGVAAPATAEGTPPPASVCTPSDAIPAWTEVTPDIQHAAVEEVSHLDYQRYSWTGGPVESAPTEVPPSDNWQANEKKKPKDDPIGIAFQQGKPGKADWFFWTATKVVDTAGEAAWVEDVPDITHPAVDAVTCFDAYEVCANWTVDNFPTNTTDWPQTRLNTDCTEPAPECSPVRIQFDKYWIRDEADAAYFAGLTTLNSPADDAQLEPHDYYVKTIAAKDCEETPPPTVQQCTSTGSVHTTDLGTWNLSETRTAGHNELTENGLHVYTDDATSQAKAAGYFPADFDLATGGSFSMDWTGSTPPPGGQMLIDLDDNGSADGYFVVEDAYGADTAWLSSNWTGIDLSAAPTAFNGGGTGKGGTFNQWLAVFPNAHVMAIGYSLGSGILGDGVISSITAGCIEYTFGLPPIPEQPADKVTVTHSDWVDSEFECSDESVTQTRTATTTTISYVLDGRTWVEGEPVVTTATETQTRPLTEEELCPIVVPEKPEPIVTTVLSESKDCKIGEVTKTTTTTTVDWVLDTENNVWVKAEPVVDVHNDTRKTEKDECPVTVVAKAPLTPQGLASTGFVLPGGVIGIASAGLLLGLAILIIGGAATRRQRRNDV
jgi:hypothetical protein